MPTIVNEVQVSNAVPVPAKMQPQRAQTDLTSIITEDITPEFGKLSYLGFSLIIKRSNGYINATHLCAQSEKKRELKHWNQLNTSKEIMEALSKRINLPVSQLKESIAGGKITLIRGTYVHPLLIHTICQWASPSFCVRVNEMLDMWCKISKQNTDAYWNAFAESIENDKDLEIIKTLEAQIADSLAYAINGEREVETSVGFIDVLTSTEIIEVKRVRLWKHALGQVLAYSSEYPNHTKVIYLFEDPDDQYQSFDVEKVANICIAFDVQIRIHKTEREHGSS